MLNVIRQEWIARRKPFLLTSALLLGINVGAFLLLLWDPEISMTLTGIWVFSGMLFTFVTGLFAVLCFGSVNISRVLTKDTSYLLLSIPYKGYVITGGKLIAGLAEFIAIGLQCTIYGFFYLIFMVSSSFEEYFGAFWKNIGFFFQFFFVDNAALMFVGFVLLVFGFLMIGVLIGAAGILIRSFWKQRKFAGLLTVVMLILMISIPFKVAEVVYESLPSVKEWNNRVSGIGSSYIPDSLSTNDFAAILGWSSALGHLDTKDESVAQIRTLVESVPFTTVFQIPVFNSGMNRAGVAVTGSIPFPVNWLYIAILLAFTAVYFIGSSWLLEKRVEV